jgi:hypothetical protein
MTGHRPPLESVSADTSRLTDSEIDQVILLLMRCVTRTPSLTTQRLLVGMVRDLTNIALARDERWVSDFAPELAAIAATMGEPGDR